MAERAFLRSSKGSHVDMIDHDSKRLFVADDE